MAHHFVKNYEILEHTADIGIRVKAKSLSTLFKNAGLSIFQLSAEKKSIAAGQQAVVWPPFAKANRQQHKISVHQKARDVDELFINWLNELLSLSSAEGLIFEDIKIENIDDSHIEALAIGTSVGNYKVNTEIKAATYHQLKLGQDDRGQWVAEVIFDV